MRILITGAGGQVGLELIKALVESGNDVIATDVRRPPENAADGARWDQLDITRKDDVLDMIEDNEPDVVYHLAAILSATGERIPQKTYNVNQNGTYHVLEACRIHNVPRVMYASTIAAFGPGLPDPVPNEISMRPTTMYGITKVAGELLGEYYTQRGWTDFRAVRFPGLINAGDPGGGTSDYALHMYVTGIAEGAYESFCTAETRIPLMYMPDAIRALIELPLAKRSDLGARCVYNIAAMSPTAGQIAASVARAVPGVELTFRSDPARQAILDSWPRALDDSAARADWGWKHEFDLETMSADLVPKIRAMLSR